MITAEVLNPHSEVELEKAIKLEVQWYISESGMIATLKKLREHQHRLKGLFNDLAVEKHINAEHRKNEKGVEIDNPLARSWHK